MSANLTFPIPFTMGNITGSATDGVLVGALTATNPTKVLTKSSVGSILCILDDGGLYTDETTDIGDAGADDVPVLPATPAVDDAAYFGNSNSPFSGVTLTIGTQGVGTWTIVWEYWTGSAWAALADVVDGTAGFTAAAGAEAVTFTVPIDWARNTVDSVLAYWVRARVSVYSAVTTQPALTVGYTTSASAIWVDDTTDATDAGTGDVELLPTFPTEGDAVYFGYTSKFCKVKATYSVAGVGTYTITWKYWNGSEWAAITTIDDDSASWITAAGTSYIHFVPPADWTANTADNGPNGQTGYFVAAELTAYTSMSAQPLLTRAWVLPLNVGEGVSCPISATLCFFNTTANTLSGTTADSTFLVVNVTTGQCASLTWTKAVGNVTGAITLAMTRFDKVALVQITEDGTTEFADGTVYACF